MADTNQRIKQYLVENGISQTYVAKEAGIPISAMSAILSGTRRLSAEEYVVICNILRVPVTKFVDEAE